MIKLARDVSDRSHRHHDLIIIGCGIYGAMLAFEATRRGLCPLVIEKDDFFNATSLNHLRTVHGGLRYLQSLDIHRFRESVGERSWFLRMFPDYVRVMPCLMPLYGKGLHRNTILRAGLLLNDALSITRNRGIQPDHRIPNGRILSPRQTRDLFPQVDPVGLTGSACWSDATVEENQRLLMAILKTAVSAGAGAFNYMEARELQLDGNRVTGVRALDHLTGETVTFQAPVVINAAGPWSRQLAGEWDSDHKALFPKALMLWNVLFDREALSHQALGLSPVKGGGHTFFFHPWKNRLLVGSPEILLDDSTREPRVEGPDMGRFIEELEVCVPGLNLKQNQIMRVYSGMLPASAGGKLSNREVLVNHGRMGGPVGFFSVSGVKFTTSRLVADKVLGRIFPQARVHPYAAWLDEHREPALSFDYQWEAGTEKDRELLRAIIEGEAVTRLSDLVMRRTSLGDNPVRTRRLLPVLRTLFNTDETRWQADVMELERLMGRSISEQGGKHE